MRKWRTELGEGEKNLKDCMGGLETTSKIHMPMPCRFLFGPKVTQIFSFLLLSLLKAVSFFLKFIFKNKFIYLFIFGCVGSSLPHAGFLQLRRAGATLPCGARASHCGGFSCCGARALGTRASVVMARGLSSCGLRTLERSLSSCGAQA